MNVTAVPVSPTAIRVTWQPPPAEQANGRIAYYKLLCVESGRGDSEATVVKLNQTSFVLDELRRWTEYRIWVLAGTSVGDGPASYPVTVRTHEDGTFPYHVTHMTNTLNFMSKEVIFILILENLKNIFKATTSFSSQLQVFQKNYLNFYDTA